MESETWLGCALIAKGMKLPSLWRKKIKARADFAGTKRH